MKSNWFVERVGIVIVFGFRFQIHFQLIKSVGESQKRQEISFSVKVKFLIQRNKIFVLSKDRDGWHF